MGKSKNDRPMNSGKIRILHNSDHGRKIASVKIIDPKTNRPYTCRQVNSILEQRKEEKSASPVRVAAFQALIQDKVLKFPDSEFVMSRTRPTVEEADKALKKEVMPDINDLTLVLFQPYLVDDSVSGTIKLKDFYRFQQNTIFSDGSAKTTPAECRSVMNTVILPVLGQLSLREIGESDWISLKKKIERKLSPSPSNGSKARYTRQALDKLGKSVHQFNKNYAANFFLLAESIQCNTKNTSIRQSFAPNYLSMDQRRAFFEAVLQERNGEYLMFLVACIYMGLTLSFLHCHCFGDIQKITTKSGQTVCFLLVSKNTLSGGKTVSVTEEEFPLKYFRNVVFSSWAAKILEQRVTRLQSCGDGSVKDLPLSAVCPDEAVLTDTEIENQLCRILGQIDGIPVQIPRKGRCGGVRLETVQAPMRLIYTDARYVLSELCKANSIARHAAFGEARNTVDEKHYLDTFCPEYTLHRYYIQSRFDPFREDACSICAEENGMAAHFSEPAQQLCIHVEASGEDRVLHLQGTFSMIAKWEEN